MSNSPQREGLFLFSGTNLTNRCNKIPHFCIHPTKRIHSGTCDQIGGTHRVKIQADYSRIYTGY
jgi:hypothetical protein